MKILKCLLAVVLTCPVLVVRSAFAVPITGDITIVGDPWVKSDTGDFAKFAPVKSVVTATQNNLQTIETNPSFFWTVNGFTFNSTSVTSDSITSSTSSTATGTGITSGNGFVPTAGNWTLTTVKNKSSVLNFTAVPPTAQAVVPDSGSTFGLLFLSLAALFGLSNLRSSRLA